MNSNLAAAYEVLWTDNPVPPDIFEFVSQNQIVQKPSDGTMASGDELLTILRIDQRNRFRTGAPYRVEDYLSGLPEIADNPDILTDLLVSEFQIQNLEPNQELISEFTSRFPNISDSFKDKLLSQDSVTRLISNNDASRATESIFKEEREGNKYFGRYRLIRMLGEGGFGTVYLALDTDLQRQVAIKVPKPEHFKRAEDAADYLNEARTVASLDHSNIVAVYDVGRLADQSVFIVSKFIDGQTLKELKAESPSIEQVVAILVDVAVGLNYAHENRLIHRDVKPGNILIEEASGTAYVTDFGLAIHQAEQLFDGNLVGTPAYMSPEQIRGEGHRLDGRSDVFALGVILYEFLTGQKPFLGSPTEIISQILHEEPRTPDSFPDVPRELSRICTKALSKRASDRHPSAAEFASDLRHWLKQEDDKSNHQFAVVPKGIRAFDSADSDFFLQLIPGPRDRDGLPESIRFWKSRIEQKPDDQESFAVGLIYGPSGSGKSSFVKAGLIPRISNETKVAFVEASPTELESRLEKAIRQLDPELPSDLTLPELITRIRKTTKQRILIVIDQFEQWLHSKQDFSAEPLVNALRQCDGTNVQSIILVRDDFWLAIARFMREIEVDLVDGENIGLIDLFGQDHAAKVLKLFGQAFGKLPPIGTDLDADQVEFVNEVINGLSDNGRVISIRLALFCEMVKDKPWTAETLAAIGGMDGVGQNYLKDTFESRGASPKHRLYASSAQNILRALLPETGTNLKGHMKSEEELREISGYSNSTKDFQQAIDILDNEVRLITPTTKESDESSSSREQVKHYQLTHDFLVQPIREWLSRNQKETRKGRAEIALEENASLWSTNPSSRYLPSLIAWANIRLFTHKKSWSSKQQKMMKDADRYYITRSILLVMIFVVILFGTIYIREGVRAETRRVEAKRIVQGLLQAEAAQVDEIIDNQLADYESFASQPLLEAFQNSLDQSNAKLYSAMALVPERDDALEYLVSQVPFVSFDQFPLLVAKIAENPKPYLQQLWTEALNVENSANVRFRHACVLANLDGDNPNWSDETFAGLVADQLVSVLPSHLAAWRGALRPVQTDLKEHLLKLFGDDSDAQKQSFATDTLLDYFRDSVPDRIELLGAANQKQFPVILQTLEQHRDPAVKDCKQKIEECLSTKDPNEEGLHSVTANLAVACMLMNEYESIWPLLSLKPDPTVRSLIIYRYRLHNGSPKKWAERYLVESDHSIKCALLYGLGNYAPDRLDSQLEDKFLSAVKSDFKNSRLAVTHSASKWLLKRWDQSNYVLNNETEWKRQKSPIDEQRKPLSKEWFVNSQGTTFSIIDCDEFGMGSQSGDNERTPVEIFHRRRIARRIAVATTEITRENWRIFSQQFKFGHHADLKDMVRYAPKDDCPMLGIRWYETAHFCNWLSEKEGIPKDQWCYIPNADGKYWEGMEIKKDFANLQGYRMLTEAEWEFVCRGGTATSRFFGADKLLAKEYCWFHENSDRSSHPIGTKLPNPYGLFDIYGNAYEWCNDIYRTYPSDDKVTVDRLAANEKVTNSIENSLRGASCLELIGNIRTPGRNRNPPQDRSLATGGRICRTISVFE